MMMPIFLLRSILPLALLFGLTGVAGAVALTPQYAGNFLNGDGANSQWVQVAADWQGATNPSQTGIWGLQDQSAVMGLHAGDDKVIQILNRRVDQINFGDQRYNTDWGATWGTAPIAPIFNNVVGENQDKGGILTANIKNAGIGLAPFHDWDGKVSDAVKAKVKEATDGLKAGTIKTGYQP